MAYKKLGLKNNTVLDETHIAHIEDGIASVDAKLDDVAEGAVTITGIRESTADGGSNVITFSDNSTLTVMNGSKGSPGDNGADGRGITKIEKTKSIGLLDYYTITYTDGTTSTFTVMNGEDGEDGYLSVLEYDESFNDGEYNRYTLTDGSVLNIKNGSKGSKGDKGDKGDTGAAGKDGANGADGFSPVVTVTEISGGHQVSITDAIGTKTFDVRDGEDGGGSGGGSADVMSDTEFADLLDDMAL